jgi:transposase-like protein
MPRSAPSPATPDLFSYVPSPPVPGARRTPEKVKSSFVELSSLSDARLARLLRELTSELQRRKAEGTGGKSRPELDQAIQDAACALESLVPQQAGRTRRPKRADAAPSLQEPKRKAIRAALQAGVAPSQVARHFGLPLAAVRKVLTGAE